jgi:hypothetical protein
MPSGSSGSGCSGDLQVARGGEGVSAASQKQPSAELVSLPVRDEAAPDRIGSYVLSDARKVLFPPDYVVVIALLP